MKAIFAVAALAFLLAPAAQVAARFDFSSLSWGNIVDPSKDLHLLQAGGATAAGRNSADRNEQDEAIVLVEYLVPPPVQGEFIEIFGKLTDEVKKEPGVKIWSLSSAIDENLRYWAYSEIEKSKASNFLSGDDDYRKEFVEAINKIGVVYKIHILDQITAFAPKRA